MDSYRVINPLYCSQPIVCGERAVWFDEHGVSDELTAEEHARLLTIPGYECLEAWKARAFQGDALAPEVARVFDGSVLPETAGAVFCDDTDALPAEGEAPPPPGCPRARLAELLRLGDVPGSQAHFAAFYGDLVESWQFQAVGARADLVKGNGGLTSDQLVELLNREIAGKNAKSVLTAIESERDGRPRKSADQINQALLRASAPAPTPEE
jgi:hypothetical protein